MTYLSKDGKVSGPFEDEKITQMKSSGEFYTYEWMWDGQAPDWSPVPRKPMAPPPLPAAPPTEEQRAKAMPQAPEVTIPQNAVPAASVSKPAPKTPKPPSSSAAKPAPEVRKSSKIFPAIVFDNRQSIGGEVTEAHAGGGKFVSTPHASSHFPKGATVFVDVLDEQKDKSAKVKGTITTISREESRWVFELEWQGLPLL